MPGFNSDDPKVKFAPRFEVRAVNFDGDDLTIQYMHLPNDVRYRGALMQAHSLTVSRKHPGWHNEIDDVKGAVLELLQDALDDFSESEPPSMEDLLGDEDEDDDRGMGE